MANLKLRVRAGNHDRHGCPLQWAVDHPYRGQPVALHLTDREGQPVPCQVATDRPADRLSLEWILPALKAGRETIFHLQIQPGQAASKPPQQGVVVGQPEGGQVDIQIAGQLFTRYHFGPELARPYFYPLYDRHGVGVTRGFGDQPGETTDHRHHRSLWIAHGDVNGVDNWSEEEGHGRTIHRHFDMLQSGPVYGLLQADNDWVSPSGDRIMEETRTIRVYASDRPGRLMDVEVLFRANRGAVCFGDTKEGGILSIRVASSMDEPRGGRIENAYGGINEQETWGKRAPWCDYSGPVGSHQSGIALFDHPHNLRHPTYWHVRNYGLMTANPFGISYFKNDPQQQGDFTLSQGQTLLFRYRLYIHEGDANQGRVGEHYHDYVSPPQVELV